MKENAGKILSRKLIELASARIREEPVILLEGPRSSGKSTIMRALAAKMGANGILLISTENRPGGGGVGVGGGVGFNSGFGVFLSTGSSKTTAQARAIYVPQE